MLEPPWFGQGEVRFTLRDELGTRVVVVPDSELMWNGDPTEIILDIEARTRTRLKDGGNPIKFYRAYNHWRMRRDPSSTVTFAEFCLRRHREAVDVLDVEAVERARRIAPGGEAVTDGFDSDRRANKSATPMVWKPRAGYVGRKTICNGKRFQKRGKNPAPTTIDGWVKSAKNKDQPIDIEKDPATRENYYPEAWIMERISLWNPRTSAT